MCSCHPTWSTPDITVTTGSCGIADRPVAYLVADDQVEACPNPLGGALPMVT
jgi:hypothetical protein